MKYKNTARIKEGLTAYAMLIPTILGMAFYSVGATIGAMALSVTDYSIRWPPNFVGIKNFVDFFHNRLFGKIILNTFQSALMNIVPCVLFALLLALLVNQKIPGVKFYRMVYFWPVVASMAAVSLLWGFLLSPEFGLVNYLLSTIGIDGPAWFGSTKWALPSVSVIFVWKLVGYYMTMLLVGLQNIPQSLYESAMLDGVGPFQRTLHITLPLLSPTLFMVIIMACIASFQVFDPILVLGLNGGPAHATKTLSYYIYQSAFQNLKMGYASAVSVVLFLIVGILSMIQFKLQNKWVFYN